VHLAENWPHLPLLAGVVETPVIRADGSILQLPGYDAVSGLVYKPCVEGVRVPERPTLTDARAAAAVLYDLVSQFPFENPGVHFGAWLAACLTPPARLAFSGPSPLFLGDANVAGAGKSLLAKLAGIVSTGHEPAVSPWPDDNEEQEKLITTILMEGSNFALIDNVEGVLGGKTLNRLLTSTTWKNRILGENRSTGELPCRTLWYATGNNARLGADSTRRTIHIRLSSPLVKPEERTDLRHKSIIEWAKQNLATLVAAPPTILAAWFAAGKPQSSLRAEMGSFEGWSMIRHVLMWLGSPDPLDSQAALSEKQSEVNSVWTIVDAVARIVGNGPMLTATELLSRAQDLTSDAGKALLEHCAGEDGRVPHPRGLADTLAKHEGRNSGDNRVLFSSTDGKTRKKVWGVRPV
jgi:hypothetical protein